MAAFAWSAAADIGFRLLPTIANALTGSASTAAKNRNLIRAAQNQQRIAEAGLAETLRRVNNDRIMAAAGDKDRALVLTALRTQEAFVAGQFDRGIRDMEKLGAVTAQAAAAGAGGGSVDALGQVLDLQAARLAQADQEQFEDRQYEFYMARTGLMSNMVQSLDNSYINPQIDRSVDAVPSTAGQLFTGLINAAGEKGFRESANTLLGSLYSQKTGPSGENYSIAPTEPMSQMGLRINTDALYGGLNIGQF